MSLQCNCYSHHFTVKETVHREQPGQTIVNWQRLELNPLLSGPKTYNGFFYDTT